MRIFHLETSITVRFFLTLSLSCFHQMNCNDARTNNEDTEDTVIENMGGDFKNISNPYFHKRGLLANFNNISAGVLAILCSTYILFRRQTCCHDVGPRPLEEGDESSG